MKLLVGIVFLILSLPIMLPSVVLAFIWVHVCSGWELGLRANMALADWIDPDKDGAP